MLIAVGPARAGEFASGHIFIHDNVWRDGDVLEYDAAGTFVRSFAASLPDTYGIGGLGHLRWGPDGRLYQFGELDRGDGAGWMTGVFEWGAGGQLIQFYATPSWMNAGGFAVLDNGNWAVTSFDGIDLHLKEYSRDFSQSWDFTGGPLDSQGLYMHGGLLYNAQNHSVAVWDPSDRSFVRSFTTSEDNNDLTISADGLVAVNFQWHDENRADFVEVLDIDGTHLGDAVLGDNDLIAQAGVAFQTDGALLVVSGYDLGTSWAPKLAVFDDTMAFVGFMELDGWREPGSIAVAIPEPTSMSLLALALAAVASRRRR